MRGIEELNDPRWGIDVIIAGRGGGSFEDLLPFSEEEVVRAFAASRCRSFPRWGTRLIIRSLMTPQTGRSHTPAAAEKAIPVKADLAHRVNELEAATGRALRRQLEQYRLRLDHATGRRVMREPLEMIAMRGLSLDDCRNRMYYSLREQLSWFRQRLTQIPDMQRIVDSQLREKKLAFGSVVRALDQLSPLKTLERGYSITRNLNGTILRSIQSVAPHEALTITVADGTISCTVEATSPEEFLGKEER